MGNPMEALASLEIPGEWRPLWACWWEEAWREQTKAEIMAGSFCRSCVHLQLAGLQFPSMLKRYSTRTWPRASCVAGRTLLGHLQWRSLTLVFFVFVALFPPLFAMRSRTSPEVPKGIGGGNGNRAENTLGPAWWKDCVLQGLG